MSQPQAPGRDWGGRACLARTGSGLQLETGADATASPEKEKGRSASASASLSAVEPRSHR